MREQKKRHGLYTMEFVDPNLIMIRAFDSWNLEQTEAFCEELNENFVSHIEHAPWGFVADISQWGLCPPEAMARFNQLAEDLGNRNERFLAVISHTNIQGSLAKEYVNHAGNILTTRYFKDANEGIQWCREQLGRGHT
ncbi:hypothetical protein [Dongshaea marina]|uniref:hypothetical protein n=1 Tax=Dongshaea marina TaxID=2047966 RepID=UPI000D3E0627|nr:hypothetical protein [Dongshaea marina]